MVTDGTVVWTDATYSPTWALTKPYAGSSANVPYTIQLSPAILSGEQPRSLPNRIVIDLRSSVLPTSWPSPSASSNLDVLFSPQGVVTGQVASNGRIHFVLSDTADTTAQTLIAGLSNRFQLNAPWQPGAPYQAGNVIVPAPVELPRLSLHHRGNDQCARLAAELVRSAQRDRDRQHRRLAVAHQKSQLDRLLGDGDGPGDDQPC